MSDVLLATCAAFPEGEERGTALLVDALAARGLSARWVVWDDPAVDWNGGLVAVRATWDYERRRDEFLAWAWSLPRMLNSAAAFAWNTDKSYLAELGEAGVPVVPTVVVAGEEDLPSAIAGVDAAVVKPCIGAGGRGVVVFDGTDGGPEGLDESALVPGPWVVQPLVESIRTEGELSVFVLGGRVVSQARKLPAAGDIRVHEEYGGRTEAIEVTDEASALALAAVSGAERLLGERLDYARVDALRLADGTLVVGELEVTEPGLYLDRLPRNAESFAELAAGVLGR